MTQKAIVPFAFVSSHENEDLWFDHNYSETSLLEDPLGLAGPCGVIMALFRFGPSPRTVVPTGLH